MNTILIIVAILLVGSALSGWRGRRQGRQGVHAASWSAQVLKALVIFAYAGRALTALAGAVIGSGLALLDAKYLAETGYVPQTTAGWFALYGGLCEG